MKRFTIILSMIFILFCANSVWSDEGNEDQSEDAFSVLLTPNKKHFELGVILTELEKAHLITELTLLKSNPPSYYFKTTSFYWPALLRLVYESQSQENVEDLNPPIPIERIFTIELIATKDSDAELKEALDILKKAVVIHDLEIVAESPSRYKLKTASPYWAKALKEAYGVKENFLMPLFPQNQQEDAVLQDVLQKLLNEKLVVYVVWPKCFPGEYTVRARKISVLKLLNTVFPAESLADPLVNSEQSQYVDSNSEMIVAPEQVKLAYSLLEDLVSDEVISDYKFSFVTSIDEGGEVVMHQAGFTVDGAGQAVSKLFKQKLDFSVLRKWYPCEEDEVEDSDSESDEEEGSKD